MLQLLSKAAQFWVTYSVPEVVMNQDAIAKYIAAMEATAVQDNSLFQQLIGEGNKSRGAAKYAPYQYGDLTRGEVANWKI